MSSESRERTAFAVALTGGIASGKSAVANQFAALGVPLIDADALAHALVQPGQPALAEIVEVFGTSVLTATGELNRKRVREIVFDDAALRAQLERILHPRIHAAIVESARDCSAPYCVLAIPLFVEKQKDYSWVDRVLVTDVPEALQITRLAARPDIDVVLAQRILAAQAARERRLSIAHDIIDNTAPINRLGAVVERLHRRYTQLAAIRRSRMR